MNPRRYGKKAANAEENINVTEPVQETPVAAVTEAEDIKPAKATKPKNDVAPTRSKTMALCNMRKTPRIESSNILCTIAKGEDIIKFVGEDHGDFFRVKYNDKEGFIKKELCE